MLKSAKSSRINQAALALSQSSASSHAGKTGSELENDINAELESSSIEISDILTKRYGGVSIYGAVMLLLAIAIVWTAVITASLVQRYHQQYMTLQHMKSDYRKLRIENQRLIIEQQTFSATPQIANRAVTQLGMYSPTVADKLILQPTAKQSQAALVNRPSAQASQQQTNGEHGE